MSYLIDLTQKTTVMRKPRSDRLEGRPEPFPTTQGRFTGSERAANRLVSACQPATEWLRARLARSCSKAPGSTIGTPDASFETRRADADLTWLTFGAEVSLALKKR
jgi:hypothetical protein